MPGIGSWKIVRGALAHVESLLFLKSSVKVVRHRNGESCCGRLWKKNVRRPTLVSQECVAGIGRPSRSGAKGPAPSFHRSVSGMG